MTIMPIREAQKREEPGGRWLKEKVAMPEKGGSPAAGGEDGEAYTNVSLGASGGIGGGEGGNEGGGGDAAGTSVPTYTLAA
jgi:hypothetical protein